MFKITEKTEIDNRIIYIVSDASSDDKFKLPIEAIEKVLRQAKDAFVGIVVKNGKYSAGEGEFDRELAEEVVEKLNLRVDNAKKAKNATKAEKPVYERKRIVNTDSGIYVKGFKIGNTNDECSVEIEENGTIRNVSVAELKKIIAKQNVNGIKENGSDGYIVNEKLVDSNNLKRALNDKPIVITSDDVEHVNKAKRGGLRAFKLNGYWGGMNEKGEMIISAVYDEYIDNPTANMLQFMLRDNGTGNKRFIVINNRNKPMAVSKFRIGYEDRKLIRYNAVGNVICTIDIDEGTLNFVQDAKYAFPVIESLGNGHGKGYFEYRHVFKDGKPARDEDDEYVYDRKLVIAKIKTGAIKTFKNEFNREKYEVERKEITVYPEREYMILDGINFNIKGIAAVKYDYAGTGESGKVWSFINKQGMVYGSSKMYADGYDKNSLGKHLKKYMFKNVLSMNDNMAVVETLDGHTELYSFDSNNLLSEGNTGYTFMKDNKFRQGFDQIVEVGDKYFIRNGKAIYTVYSNTLRLVSTKNMGFKFEIANKIDYGVVLKNTENKVAIMMCNGEFASAVWFNSYKRVGNFDMFEVDGALYVYTDKQITKLCIAKAALGIGKNEIYGFVNGQLRYMVEGVAAAIQIDSEAPVKEIRDLYDGSTVRVIEFTDGTYSWIATEDFKTNNKKYGSLEELKNEKVIKYRETV